MAPRMILFLILVLCLICTSTHLMAGRPGSHANKERIEAEERLRNLLLKISVRYQEMEEAQAYLAPSLTAAMVFSGGATFTSVLLFRIARTMQLQKHVEPECKSSLGDLIDTNLTMAIALSGVGIISGSLIHAAFIHPKKLKERNHREIGELMKRLSATVDELRATGMPESEIYDLLDRVKIEWAPRYR